MTDHSDQPGMVDEGGEAACWLDGVCDRCGAVVEPGAAHRCRASVPPESARRPVTTTSVARHIQAPRGRVYRALIDPAAVQRWMVPEQMTSHVHTFDAREGGGFRISLTYESPTSAGKTTAQTDSYHGRFVRLVPDSEVVQVVEFDSGDPNMQGEMTITFTLTDSGGGTDLVAVHEDVPPGVDPAQNEVGWNMSIDKLARLVEHNR